MPGPGPVCLGRGAFVAMSGWHSGQQDGNLPPSGCSSSGLARGLGMRPMGPCCRSAGSPPAPSSPALRGPTCSCRRGVSIVRVQDGGLDWPRLGCAPTPGTVTWRAGGPRME